MWLDGETSSDSPVTSSYVDLPDKITSQVRLFADDTAVYLMLTNKDDPQTLQQDLIKLEHWEKTWEMHFNPSKCQSCTSVNPRIPSRPNMFYMDKKVQVGKDQEKAQSERDSHTKNRGGKKPTANYYKYHFFPLEQWNNLPTSAVQSEDLTTFRSTICSLYHIMP